MQRSQAKICVPISVYKIRRDENILKGIFTRLYKSIFGNSFPPKYGLSEKHMILPIIKKKSWKISIKLEMTELFSGRLYFCQNYCHLFLFSVL